MEINSVNGVLGLTNSAKTGMAKVPSGLKKAVEGSKTSTTDKVDISTSGSLEAFSDAAKSLMDELKKAILDTIPQMGESSSVSSLNSIAGTPLDSFVTGKFANLSAESKQEFMSYFKAVSKTSNGIVPSEVISQAFGGSANGADAFPQMIASVTSSLQRYM